MSDLILSPAWIPWLKGFLLTPLGGQAPKEPPPWHSNGPSVATMAPWDTRRRNVAGCRCRKWCKSWVMLGWHSLHFPLFRRWDILIHIELLKKQVEVPDLEVYRISSGKDRMREMFAVWLGSCHDLLTRFWENITTHTEHFLPWVRWRNADAWRPVPRNCRNLASSVMDMSWWRTMSWSAGASATTRCPYWKCPRTRRWRTYRSCRCEKMTWDHSSHSDHNGREAWIKYCPTATLWCLWIEASDLGFTWYYVWGLRPWLYVYRLQHSIFLLLFSNIVLDHTLYVDVHVNLSLSSRMHFVRFGCLGDDGFWI